MPRFDKLLVLDLDETLVYSTRAPLERRPDFWWGGFAVYLRPGVERFVQQCLELFQVGIWTASDPGYAHPVLARLLDVDRLAFVLTGEKCVVKFDPSSGQQVVVKNLAVVRRMGWTPGRILVVDNHPTTFLLNPENGLEVPDFRGEPDDDCLSHLARFLEDAGQAPDVRTLDRSAWQAFTSGRRSSVGSHSGAS